MKPLPPLHDSLLAVVHHRWLPFHIGWSVQPLLALLAGVLILIRPKLLNLIVAVYLIAVGLIGLFHLL